MAKLPHQQRLAPPERGKLKRRSKTFVTSLTTRGVCMLPSGTSSSSKSLRQKNTGRIAVKGFCMEFCFEHGLRN